MSRTPKPPRSGSAPSIRKQQPSFSQHHTQQQQQQQQDDAESPNHVTTGNNNSNNSNNNNTGGSSNTNTAKAAPLATAKKKQHQHLLMTQLRNAIQETYQAPPDGATEAMVLERRKQLQHLLDTVEKQYQQSKEEVLQSYNDRWLRAFEKEVEREHKGNEENRRKTEASLAQASLVSKLQLAKIQELNKTKQQRRAQCVAHLFETKKSKSKTLEHSMERKTQVYNDIQAKREAEGLEHLRRQIESEHKIEEMLRRKRELDEEDRNRREALAGQRRRAADERLEKLRIEREEQARASQEHATDAYRNASRKKYSVVLRPKPHLEEIENDWEARNRRQAAAEKERADLVARIQAEQRAVYDATVAARHRKNQEMQRQNMDRQLNEHAALCDETRRKLALEREETKRKLAERDAENLMRLHMKDEDVSLHRQRHAANVHQHQDEAKRRVYERWNRQLEQVSQELGVELPRCAVSPLPAASLRKTGGAATPAGTAPATSVSPPPPNVAASFRKMSTVQQPQQQQQQQQQRGADFGSGGADHHSITFMTQQAGRETPAAGRFGHSLSRH